ncbi:MAG: hypothetical protein KJN81_05045 [Acidimicrobiia bacterium]|nr:hypothetical protein [Acidimicrobiia bacterium]NNC41875.1 hypothetical protein [Acidimicrobiia bacterium]NND13310.1 hypothetical protein [Acidimicrobiia bacterium]NNL27778.1 hypothetical protein [Acidimicrobiia bacterium]NNL48343.1 hypothetical protein [Acidimicrobiia bacterium]
MEPSDPNMIDPPGSDDPFDYGSDVGSDSDIDGVPMARATVGDLQTLIEDMIVTVEQAKSAALSASKAVIDRAAFTQNLHLLRDALPEELRQARHMVRERAAFVAQANEQAREIIARAKAKGAELVSETQIMAEAVEEANILVRNAEQQSTQIRLDAEDAVGVSLEDLDELLTRLLTEVRYRRQELLEPRQPSPDVPY